MIQLVKKGSCQHRANSDWPIDLVGPRRQGIRKVGEGSTAASELGKVVRNTRAAAIGGAGAEATLALHGVQTAVGIRLAPDGVQARLPAGEGVAGAVARVKAQLLKLRAR